MSLHPENEGDHFHEIADLNVLCYAARIIAVSQCCYSLTGFDGVDPLVREGL
jgi:hypothetical protein